MEAMLLEHSGRRLLDPLTHGYGMFSAVLQSQPDARRQFPCRKFRRSI